MRSARPVLVAACLVAALVLVATTSGLLVDALWFREVDAQVVFRTRLVAQAVCFAVAFVASGAVLAAVGLLAVRQVRDDGVVRVVFRHAGDGRTTIPELIAPIAGRVPWRPIVWVVATVAGIVVGLAQAGDWETYLLWRHGGTFGVADPLFGRDVGFFVFQLPAYRALLGTTTFVLILAALLAGVVFWLHGAIDVNRPDRPLSPGALRVFALLLGVLLLVKAAGHWLGRYELLLAPDGAVFGAGYTATHVTLPLQWLLVTTAVVGAGLAFAAVRRPDWRLPVAAIVLVFAAGFLDAFLPDLFQRFRVRPDELRLERPYLEKNVAMTRRAYGLEHVEARPFAAEQKLDAAAIERNRATFANVRLWDPGPLLDAYRQLQLIRLYYEFHDVDVDRYSIGGTTRQVMLAAREINPSLLPPNARTWVNQRLQFTHGFGAVMSPVTELEGEGLPTFFLRDIPPRSDVGIALDQPRIYFGEQTRDYVVVNAAAEEFDHPRGDQNVTNTYDGRGGIALGSLLRRALFAWRFGDVNLLISGNLRSESRLLFRRALRDRIGTIAPFLRLDRDPYLVVAGGRLVWMQDAYTTARTYPYAEPVPGTGINYIRNAVKITLDAYDGTVRFYASDANDPVLAAYDRIFPGLFHPLAEMPEELRAHVRYPEDLFLIQTEMYRTYHMTNADVFYNKEDLWSRPVESDGEQRSAAEPYYVIMKLPGETREELVLMQPMTPANRSNMVAWLAARSDAPHYGDLVEFQFPKERLVYGPQQIEARIDQDTTISQQLSLWNQMGSKVIRGNLLVIPVEDAVVYVEPLYLRSTSGQIPELKRVIVAYDDRLAMAQTLDAALGAVFAPAAVRAAAATAPIPETAPPQAPAEPRPATSARDHYRAALEALRGGDWARFGREMDALGRTLETPGEAP